MKYIKFTIYILALNSLLSHYAAENCISDNKPTLDLKNNGACIVNQKIDVDFEMDIEVKQPEFNPELSYQENLNLRNLSKTNLEQANKSSDNIDAFIQPYKFRKRDDTNSNNRYQHNLDNFRLPVFTCDLPSINSDRLEAYSIEEITQLDIALKKYHFCLNISGDENRETFKNFIINKLDGQIIPSKGQKIQWATLPEHKQQTMNIMSNINKLYDDRYTQYLNYHKQLQALIKNFNHNAR